MLSRRNVRIKVMQLLYMDSKNESLGFNLLLDAYRKSIDTSYELFLFNLYQFVKVVQYARKDATKRKAKLLPTPEDKTFTIKLASNPLSYSLSSNYDFRNKIDEYRFQTRIDEDNIRSIYAEFSKTKLYKDYLSNASTTAKEDSAILLALYKHCTTNELFNDAVEDHYPFWADDKSLVIGTIKKVIRALPADDQTISQFAPNAETVEFGEELIRYTYFDSGELLDIIEPVLNNWDAERVANIDMILLKMALTELMQFPSIPTKVTLNEFVEIAKLYSTDKSKDFINGILDRLMKQLAKDGKITKKGRGLRD